MAKSNLHGARYGWACCHLTYLKRVSFVCFIDSGQHRFVDPEAQGGCDQRQRQVTHNTDNDNNYWSWRAALWGQCDPPDQGDVAHRQEAHQDWAAHDARVPGVIPVEQGVHLVWAGPHGHEAGAVSLDVAVVCVVVTPGSPGLGVTEVRRSGPSNRRQPRPRPSPE